MRATADKLCEGLRNLQLLELLFGYSVWSVFLLSH